MRHPYSIRQVGPTTWELRDAPLAADTWNVLGTFEDADGNPGIVSEIGAGYTLAASALSGILRAAAMADPSMMADDTGMLADRWVSDAGIAFQERLPGGRDFTNCTWSWREPTSCLVALLLMTETNMGHMGAELAGFVEEFSQSSGTVAAAGRFYDSDLGIKARDLLLDGRRFGVSVDPTENYECEFQCTEYDEDGWCVDGDMLYLAYEIGAVTMVALQGFENASIVLDTTEKVAATAAPRRLRAGGGPARPPLEWFTLAEPQLGASFLDTMGDEFLVDQGGGTLACPLQILDSGQIFGHLTFWGQCHVGEPWGPGVCASAQPSATGYREFLVGQVATAEGPLMPTGELFVGCEHSAAFVPEGVRDHFAHAGMGWASVNIIDGEFGPWLRGSLRPGITDEQVRVLRALSLSGEWVGDLAGVVAVNRPGLPIQRVMAASGGPLTIPVGTLRASVKGGEVTKLVGANLVRRCPECEERARLGRAGGMTMEQMARRMEEVSRTLALIERRTRPLVASAADGARELLHRKV
jgi:hypothetical protein